MNKKKQDTEWTHWFEAKKADDQPVALSVEADKTARDNLARRFQLHDIDSLRIDVVVQRTRGTATYEVIGTLSGDIVQKCTVTAEPVPEKVEADIEAYYISSEDVISLSQAKRDRLENISGIELEIPNEREDPEALTEGQVNLGELAAQFLSLSMSPYPKSEEAVAKNGEAHIEAPTPRNNPFAALKDWKKDKNKDLS